MLVAFNRFRRMRNTKTSGHIENNPCLGLLAPSSPALARRAFERLGIQRCRHQLIFRNPCNRRRKRPVRVRANGTDVPRHKHRHNARRGIHDAAPRSTTMPITSVAGKHTSKKQPRRNHLKAVINHRRHRGSPRNKRFLGQRRRVDLSGRTEATRRQARLATSRKPRPSPETRLRQAALAQTRPNSLTRNSAYFTSRIIPITVSNT